MMGLTGRYTVQPSPLDEDALQIELAEKNYSPQDYARTLAERKAQAMAVTMSRAGEVTTLIIGSDTIVDLDGSISEFDFNAESYRSTLNNSSW
jgi:predicted house-cleaning NTP pyrophosphatase (Maf/HAM1 superfamily)